MSPFPVLRVITQPEQIHHTGPVCCAWYRKGVVPIRPTVRSAGRHSGV